MEAVTSRARVAAAALLMLLAAATCAEPVLATGGHDKPLICHPVEGKGETGTGWNLISPDKASSHIDEATGAGKHTRKDGRTDVYAVDGLCPGQTPTPTTTTTGGTPSPSSTTTGSPSVTTTSGQSPSPSSSTPSSDPSPSHSTSPSSTTTPSTPTETSASPSSTSPKPSSASVIRPTSPRPNATSTTADPTPEAHPRELAYTGSSTLPALAIAGALLFLGLAALIAGRRNGGDHR